MAWGHQTREAGRADQTLLLTALGARDLAQSEAGVCLEGRVLAERSTRGSLLSAQTVSEGILLSSSSYCGCVGR